MRAITPLLILAILLLIAAVSAVPTTQAVTVIGPGKVVFSANGGTGLGWFKWGAISGDGYYWTTWNQSVSGSFTDYQDGPPLISGQTYYVVACDSTGCGNEVSFSVPATSPMEQTGYGNATKTIQRSGFNLTQVLPLLPAPYTAQIGFWTWALLFFFIFSGWWMRTGDITLPMFGAFVFGALIWGTGTGLGLPPDVQDIGLGLAAAALAGMIFSWFTK